MILARAEHVRGSGQQIREALQDFSGYTTRARRARCEGREAGAKSDRSRVGTSALSLLGAVPHRQQCIDLDRPVQGLPDTGRLSRHVCLARLSTLPDPSLLDRKQSLGAPGQILSPFPGLPHLSFYSLLHNHRICSQLLYNGRQSQCRGQQESKGKIWVANRDIALLKTL
jgi:hypothetical protein